MNNEPPLLSVVIPAYQEGAAVAAIYQRLALVLTQEDVAFEIVFVDDGSSDDTLARIKALAREDARVRYASFSRNFGHEAASSCGMAMVRGQAVVLMDADLQDPPELVPQMWKMWLQGYEVVYAHRIRRVAEPLLKRFSSWLFYRLLNMFSEVRIPEDVGDFRLMDRRVVDRFNEMPENSRFVRGMVAWLGFRQTSIEYDRPPRSKGETKYNFRKLLYLSLDALTGFSIVPLRLCVIAGYLVTLASFLMALVIVIQRLFFDVVTPGYALATAGMFFLGGVQLVFLGIIAEYIGKVYRQVQGRPLYVVRESSDAENGG